MIGTPTVVFVPGLLCDFDLWRPQAEFLAERIVTIVAETTVDDSVGAMAQRILDTAPEKFALAGLSMGGYVAQEVMRRAPDRVTQLALLDTSSRADTPEQVDRRKALINMASVGKFKGVTPRLMPLLIHTDRLEDKELTGIVMGMAERVGQAAFLRQQNAILNRPDGRGDLARIACRTLVACGRQDALTPLPLSEEMAAAIPGAELLVVENCGHLSTLERPDEINAALDRWLFG